MTKHTAPAADKGLPNSDPNSGSAASPKGGLMVIRQVDAGATPLGLPAEKLSELLALLDVAQSAESGIAIARGIFNKRIEGMNFSDPAMDAEREKYSLRFDTAYGLRLAAKNRRALLAHIKTIAETPAKSVEDLLFKAYIAEATEEKPTVLNSISHAIVRDLLASDCWLAPTHHADFTKTFTKGYLGLKFAENFARQGDPSIVGAFDN